MDLYNLPNDDSKAYRKRQFMSLLKNPEKGYIDGATDYCLLPAFAKEYCLSPSQRFWLAYLYGLTYSQTTALRFFLEFPEMSQVTLPRLEEFWEVHKDTLYFNHDRRYVKNNDAVIPAIMNIKRVTGNRPIAYWDACIENGFKPMYRDLKRDWYYFGPMGLYLFFDALWGLLPKWYVDPDRLDWKSCGKTVPEGMAHFLYLDEAVNSKEYPLDRFDKTVELIQQRSEQPLIIIESTLCAFRKFFKGTRYVGYYADRMLLECEQYGKPLLDKGVDLWKYREQTIPKELLGELNGWDGIREDRLRLWLEKGVLR